MIPPWAIALAAALAWGAFQHHRATAAGAELLRVEKAAAQAREEALKRGLVEQARQLAAQKEAADAAEAAAARDRAHRSRADRTAEQLRDHAGRLAAAAHAACAAPAAVGAPGGSPAGVLADMLGRVERHGRELAAEADRRGRVAAECAGRYDSLSPR